MRFRRAMSLTAVMLFAVLVPAVLAQPASADPLIPLPNQAKCLLNHPEDPLKCLDL